MAKLNSWKDVGKNDSGWLKSWKKDGSINLVPHKTSPRTRHVHSFREAKQLETRGGNLETKVVWMPFVCWESDAYHKRAKKAYYDKKPVPKPEPKPELCPLCLLLHHLGQRDDLDDDDVVFDFVGSKKDDGREITKSRALGTSKSADAFMDNLTAAFEYVMPVIQISEPEQVVIVNEKHALAKKLQKRIEADCEEYGEDEGDPQKSPLIYKWEYDKDSKSYSVMQLDRKKLKIDDATWDKIVATWEGPGPEDGLDEAEAPGDVRKLREQFEGALKIEVPIDEFFAKAEKQAKDRGPPDEDEDFDPDEIEKAAPAKKLPEKPKAEKAPPSKKPSAKKPIEDLPEEAPLDPPSRKGAAKPKVVPSPDPSDPICEDCKSPWPTDVASCPGCGATDEAEAPPPAGVSKKTTPWSK